MRGSTRSSRSLYPTWPTGDAARRVRPLCACRNILLTVRALIAHNTDENPRFGHFDIRGLREDVIVTSATGSNMIRKKV